MSCHAPSEDAEDDDREFVTAAREDDALVAKLLIRLSRSETRVPWRHLLEPPNPPPTPPTAEADGCAEGAVVTPQPAPALLPQAGTWAKRRARSAPVAAEAALADKREGATLASPTTPLSWSGGSGTSGGSASEDGWCLSTPPRLPPRRRKGCIGREDGESSQLPGSAPRLREEVCHGARRIGAPPGKKPKPEPHERGGPARVPASNWPQVGGSYEDGEAHGDAVVIAPAAIGSPAGYGSAKVAVRTVGGRVQPLRLRSRGEGAYSVIRRRQGKKKTIAELRDAEESLLLEQEEIQKALGKQKEIYYALLEQNMALKKLESKSLPLTVSIPAVAVVCEESKSEEPQHMPVPSTSESKELKELGTACLVHEEDSSEQLQCTRSFPSSPSHVVLFDLNCLPDGDP